MGISLQTDGFNIALLLTLCRWEGNTPPKNIIEMRKRILVLISKKERIELEKQGFKMGKDIFHTVSGKKTYYASESPKIRAAINALREID